MTYPQYILAKYVPDLGRMEPLNVGVFVWNHERLHGQFLDSASISFITDMAIYSDWVGRWMALAAPDRKHSNLKELLAAQEDQYILVESGFVPEAVAAKDSRTLLAFLFGELVARKMPPAAEQKRAARVILRDRCEVLIENSGADKVGDYKGAQPIVCTVQGVELPLTVTNYWGNGHPRALMHQVPVGTAIGWQNGFLTMQALLNLISKRHCAALIQGSDAASKEGQVGKRALEELCPVIDVEDQSAISRIAALARHGLN